MNTITNEMLEFISGYLSKSDVYASKAIAAISAFIINYRKQKGMTQKEFAVFMGVSQSMVSKWESADYNFTIENISQIAEKLGATFDINFTPENEYVMKHRKNEYERIKHKSNNSWSNKYIPIQSAA